MRIKGGIIGVLGFEPRPENRKPIENKALTKSCIPVLSTGLDISLQKHPDLAQIITAWPVLPKHIKTAIKALIKTHNIEAK